MSRSRWSIVDTIVILALMVIGASGFLLAPAQKHHYNVAAPTSDNQQEGSAARQANGSSAALPIVAQPQPGPSDNVPADGTTECDRACQSDERDLQAQIDMANAAWAMLWVAFAGFLVGVATLFLVWRTVEHTKAAAISAGESVQQARLATEAAQKSAAESARLGVLQLRAYLSVDTGEYMINGSGVGTPQLLRGHLSIVNNGNTFALNVIPEITLVFRNNGSESEPISVEVTGDIAIGAIPNGEPAGFSFQSGHNVFLNYVRPYGRDAGIAVNWASDPVVRTMARLTYTDVFGNTYVEDSWFEQAVSGAIPRQARRIAAPQNKRHA